MDNFGEDEELTKENCKAKTGYDYYDIVQLTGIAGYLSILRYRVPETDIPKLVTSSIKGLFPRYIVDVFMPDVQLRCRIDFAEKKITNHQSDQQTTCYSS